MEKEGDLVVRVEIPRGSRNKYEYDEELGGIALNRFLSSSVVFPTEYGFIPETTASDGEELDALVVVSEPTFPGCLVRVRPVGILMLKVDGHGDENVVCVPLNDPNWNHVEGLADIGDQLKEEMENFFVVYKAREGREVEHDGWGDADGARRCIEKARERFAESGGQ